MYTCTAVRIHVFMYIYIHIYIHMFIYFCLYIHMHAHTHTYIYIHIHIFIYSFIFKSANLFGQNLGKSGNHGSRVGNRGEFIHADAGAMFRHYPRNFQEHLRQKVGIGRGGGGEGTTNVCAFTWRVKMHSDVFLRSCVTG